MLASLHQRLAIVRRHLPVQYVLPIATLLALGFGSLFALLFHLTDVQDQMESQQEIALVRNAVEGAKRLTAHDLRDYAKWDEAVIHLVARFDPVWADDNLGPYLGATQGYDYVFVVDGADRVLYAFHRGRHRAGLDPKAILGPAVTTAMTALRNIPVSQGPLISGFSRSGDAVHLFSVASVVPLTDKVKIGPEKPHAILIARKVDPQYLGQLARDQNLPRLHMERDRSPRSEGQFALYAPDGRLVGTLVWNPDQPGTALRRQILPAFLIVGLMSCFVASIILRRGRRAVEALQFSESRALHLARHDLLTGLPNRRAMYEQLQARLEGDDCLTLLYLDLDGFKETNDVYGHGAGDELLRSVATRLTQVVPPDHLVARVGGDEFAVLMATSPAEAEAVAALILESFIAAFSVAGYRVSLGVSIGLATAAGANSAEEIVRRADSAMYAAKAEGKHCCRAYTPAIDTGRDLRKRMEHDLRIAIESGGIGVVFQPIVSADSHDIVAVEALARWLHPSHGNVPPDMFIPIAEESGLIVALGRSVLSTACREARDWEVDLAVNLSPAQFWDRGLADTVREVLAATGFPADRLELEITEGYLLRKPEAASSILAQLKAMGVRIALDDFGTGFASIGYLQQLGFDSIKIDRSFVAAAAFRPKAADLARAIVAIGDALDLPVTAEGVELPEQAILMREAGCHRLQGWLFGRPVPAAELAAWFAEGRRIAV